MDVLANPGPLKDIVLYDQEKHVSSAVWDGQVLTLMALLYSYNRFVEAVTLIGCFCLVLLFMYFAFCLCGLGARCVEVS